MSVAEGNQFHIRSIGIGFIQNDDELEKLWKLIVTNFLKWRLIPFGGAKAGCLKNNRICFSLTDAGRYLLGIDTDFEYGVDEEKQIIVQPNFDIVFLSPSPIAESMLSRFSVRTGKKIGAIFKITQQSIFKAAYSGMTSSDVMSILKECVTKKIPSNVEREIKGWINRCRRIHVHSSILIRRPDSETAGRVMSVGGRKVELITDTIVELKDPKQKNALLRNLRERGFFLDS